MGWKGLIMKDLGVLTFQMHSWGVELGYLYFDNNHFIENITVEMPCLGR